MFKWKSECVKCSEKDQLIERLQGASFELAQQGVRKENEYLEKIQSVRDELIRVLEENKILNQRIKTLSTERNNLLILHEEEIWMSKQPKKFIKAIDCSGLSIRILNVLKSQGIKTYAELSTYSEAEFLRIPNFGRGSLSDLKEHIKEKFPDDHADYFKLFGREREERADYQRRISDFNEAVKKHNLNLEVKASA